MQRSHLLGRGGTADVFFGYFRGREVAVKVPRPKWEDHLAQEADMHWMFKERSAGKPGAFDHIPEPIIRGAKGLQVVSFLPGEPLREWMNHPDLRPSRAETLQVFGTFLAVLQRFHDAGMVHGDIAVRNVLVHKGHARLLDFTAARPFGRKSSFPDGQILDVRSTAAPETYQNADAYVAGREPAYGPAAGATMDVYMAGAMLMQILLRRIRPRGVPEKAETAILVSNGTMAQAWLAEVDGLQASPEMKAFLRRALAFRPRDRFRDAAHMAAAFQELPDLRPSTSSGVQPVAPRHPVDELLDAADPVTGVINEAELLRLRAVLAEVREQPWPELEDVAPPSAAPAPAAEAKASSDSGERLRTRPGDTGTAPFWQAQPAPWRNTPFVLEFTEEFYKDLVRARDAEGRRKLLRRIFQKQNPAALQRHKAGQLVRMKIAGHHLLLTSLAGEDGRLVVRLLGFKPAPPAEPSAEQLAAAARVLRRNARPLKDAPGDADKVAEIKGHLHLGPAPLPGLVQKIMPLLMLLLTLGITAWAPRAAAALPGTGRDAAAQAAPAAVTERALGLDLPSVLLNGPARPVLFEVRVNALLAGQDVRSALSAPPTRDAPDPALDALLAAAGSSDQSLSAAYARLRNDPRARAAAARRALAELNQDGAWLWAALLHATGHSLFTALRPGERPPGGLSPAAWDMALLVRESAARGADASALDERARLLYDGPRRRAALLRPLSEAVRQAVGDPQRLLVFDVSDLFRPDAEPAAQGELRDTLRALNDNPAGLAGRVVLANNRGSRAQLNALAHTLPALAPQLEHRPGGPIPLGALARRAMALHAFVLSADNVDQAGLPAGSVVELLLGLDLVRDITQTVAQQISAFRFVRIAA